MKKYILLLLIITFYSCENVEKTTVTEYRIWKPEPISLIGDKSISLNWFNHMVGEMVLRPFTFVDPDYFEIYCSEKSLNNFQIIADLKNDKTYEYSFSNLQNGCAYYFCVISKKDGFTPLSSDTIMVIPNPKPNTEEIINIGVNHSIVSASYAQDINKIAYVDKFYRWNGGKNCCMNVAVIISTFDGSNTELLETSSYEPDWSPDNLKIVYRTEKGEVNTGNGTPSQIALFDYKTKEITHLTDDSAFNYHPAFSKDGSKILFQSSFKSPYKYSTDIWLIDLVTSEKKQITNLLIDGFFNTRWPNWINDDEFLFQGTLQNNVTNIYKSSLISKQINPVIISQWHDYCPSISSDGKKIAFISDRSGNNQIWLYNLELGKYTQLTGFDPYKSLDESWNKIEWIDDSHIMFTISENKLIKLRI